MRIDLVPLFSYRSFDRWTASFDPIPPIAPSNITYQVKAADQAWLGMVANRMGGCLIEINYQDDSIFISSIIVEIEEETLTMFMLSLE